jgi:hypothetical protein
VLATLDGAPPQLVRTFAAGLRLSPGPAALFAQPVAYYADVLEHEDVSGALANLAMRRALRKAAQEGSLVSKLADAREPFWTVCGDALAVVKADMLPA